MKNKWGGPQEYPWEYIKRESKPHYTSRYNFARSRPTSRYPFVLAQGSEVGNVEPDDNWRYLKKKYPVQEGAGKKKRRKTKKTKKRKTKRRKNRRRKTRRTHK